MSAESGNPYFRVLTPLLDALGWRGDKGALRRALPVRPGAMSLSELRDVMANLKFRSHEVHLRTADIHPSLFPVIFVSKEGGVALIRTIDQGKVFFFNAMTGTYVQQAHRDTEGVVVFFQPVVEGHLSLHDVHGHWMRELVIRFRAPLGSALFCSFCLSILALISTALVSLLYGQMSSVGQTMSLFYLFLGVGIYLLAFVVFRALRAGVLNALASRISFVASTEIMRRILYLPASATESSSLGSQLAQVRDFDGLRDFVSGPAFLALLDLPFSFLLLLALTVVDPVVALVPLFSILLYLAIAFFLTPLVQRVNVNASLKTKDRQNLLLNLFTEISAVRMVGGLAFWRERFRELSSHAALASYRSARMNSLLSELAAFLAGSAGLVTVAVAVHRVWNGSLTTSGLMAVTLLVWKILGPLRVGFGVGMQLGRIQRSADQVNRLMAMPVEERASDLMSVKKDLRGMLSMQAVSLRYRSELPPALLGVEWDARAGETIALVGHSGSGRSSLLKILLQLQKPQAGRVTVDGVNLRQLNPTLLRRDIVYVPSRYLLFSGTIRENMRLLCPNDDEIDFAEVLEKVDLWDVVRSLPNGIDTKVNEVESEVLTDSFQKKIAISSIFLKPGALVVLDMPEAHLSLKERQKIIDVIKMMNGKRTVIMATECEEFAALATRVLWLERGYVRMFGERDAVLKQFWSSTVRDVARG